jgi:hypothetical protein
MRFDQRLLLSLGNSLLIPFGQDGSGRNAIHANAKRTHLIRQDLRHDLNASFGGSVSDWDVARGPACRRRGHRDDVARSALFHSGQHAFDRQERGGQIAIDRCVPALFVDFLERAGFAEISTRIRDQNIDLAEFRFDA